MAGRNYTKKTFYNYISEIYVLCLLFLLPLLFNKGFFNITETKAAVFFTLALSVLALALVGFLFSLNKKKIEKCKKAVRGYKPELFELAFFGFGGAVVLSALLSKYQSDVWIGANSRYQGALVILIHLALFMLIGYFYKESKYFLPITLSAFSLVCFFGVLNCFDIDLLGIYANIGKANKALYISTIGNIDFYSSYICLLLPLAIVAFCLAKGKRAIAFSSVALIIASCGMVVTATEGFLIGFGAAFSVMPFFMLKTEANAKRFLVAAAIMFSVGRIFLWIYDAAETTIRVPSMLRTILSPIVAAVVIAVCVAGYLLVKKCPSALLWLRRIYLVFFVLVYAAITALFVLANIRDVGEWGEHFKFSEKWGHSRGKIYIFCAESFSQYSLKEKLFGIGPEALYQLSGEAYTTKKLDQAHSEYLQILMTGGIVGLLSYLSLIAATITAFLRRLKSNVLAAGIFSGLVGYWAHAGINMAQPFTTPIMYLFIALIFAFYIEARKNEPITAKNKRKGKDSSKKVFQKQSKTALSELG